MRKIFIDTNVWLRFFLRDNDQYASVKKLVELVEEGKFLPYISPIVLLELTFVLGKTYKLPKEKLNSYVQAILDIRNLTIIEKTDTKRAIKWYEEINIKFTDCLIASQMKEDMVLVSFDREFLKIKPIKLKSPEELN